MAEDPNATATTQVAALDQAQQAVRSDVAAGKTPTEVRVPDPSKEGGYQVFRADSPEQLIQVLAEAKANSNRYIAEELKPLKDQIAALTQRLQPVLQMGQPVQDTVFDKRRYFELLETNPIEAGRYLRTYDPEYQELQSQLESQRLRDTGTVFMSRHPEFSNAPEDADRLIGSAVRLMKQFNPTVADDVLARRITPDIMEAAYALGVSRNEFKPVQQAQQQTRPGLQPPPNLPSAAPPMETAAVTLAEQIANARTEGEAEELVRRAGLTR